MSLFFSEDELVKMCQQLDAIEADLRRHEHRIYAMRMRLMKGVRSKRKPECGFVETLDETQQQEQS